MKGTTSSLILLIFSVAFAESTAPNGTFFCNCLWPHNYECFVINYNSSSKWLIFNDSQSTLLHLYKMTIRNAGDTKNLVGIIFKNYKFLSVFFVHNAKPSFEISETTFENAKEIKKLGLFNNQIKSLHENMFKNMKKIEWFDATRNHIEVLYSKTFQGLQHLNFISLSDNKLTQIEFGTFDNLNLASLTLHRNLLIDFDFRNLNVSDNINVSFNTLCVITANDSMIDMEATYLKLSQNKLTEIPTNLIKHFKKLQSFVAFENSIEYLHYDTFEGFHNLKEIFLDENKISFFENGTFYNLTLEHLDLSNNRLAEFDFSNLKVNSVYLYSNLLTELTINGDVEKVYADYNSISIIYIATQTLLELDYKNNSKNIRIKYV